MKHLALLFAGIAISTTTLQAQTSSSGVPDSHRPPPGMCRIWIDGVPPTHQPAPTDCATAIRKRPMNARVVFGSDAPAGSARTFAPMQSAPNSFAPQQSAPSHDDQERQRIEAQRIETQRIEAQRQHDEQEKRNTRPVAPPPAPAPPQQSQERPREHTQEHTAPPRPRVEKTPRPPHESYSPRRHG